MECLLAGFYFLGKLEARAHAWGMRCVERCTGLEF